MGFALWQAQAGRKSEAAKPLKGFGGAGVLEIINTFASGTYRGVYTVRFAGAVYVLHVFQKTSKSGITTPIADITLIHNRLRAAEEDYAQWRSTQTDEVT